MPTIPFRKYHGAGNDFVLIDARDQKIFYDLPRFARKICERRWGIGADGLLLLQTSPVATCRMRIFNADGSEPSMCGNGLRCVVDFLLKNDGPIPDLRIETLHGILKCALFDEEISIHLGEPSILHWPIEIEEGSLYVLNTGVPHAVLFVDNLNEVDVAALGRKIRFDPRFVPHGVNVNFASLDPKACLHVRTYERGVEAETLACGTGGAATAFVAKELFPVSIPLAIHTRISLNPQDFQYQSQVRFLFPQGNQIEMLGTAHEVFAGEWKLESVTF